MELTEQHQPDIVFLYIRMPVHTGVDAARQIAPLATYGEAGGWPDCEIVFITAYDQYAVQAFEQGVVDYVLKPAERERLQVTVQRLQQRMAERARQDADGGNGAAPLPTHTPDQSQKFTEAPVDPADPGDCSPKHSVIPVEEVLFFISDEKYTPV